MTPSGTYELSPSTSEEASTLLASILVQRPRSRFTLSQVLRSSWARSIRRQDTTALLLPAMSNRALSTQLPTHAQFIRGSLSGPELKALSALASLGVPTSSLDQYRAQGVRSAVGGIYRILLHRLQQGLPINPGLFLTPDDIPPGSGSSSRGRSRDWDDEEIKGLSMPLAIGAPKGLLVPTGAASRLLRKQVAYEVQNSSTCAIL